MDGYVYVDADPQFKKLLDMIFTDEFMRENTNFDNFEGFRYSSAVITNWDSDKIGVCTASDGSFCERKYQV